jgi:hypothetical protein
MAKKDRTTDLREVTSVAFMRVPPCRERIAVEMVWRQARFTAWREQRSPSSQTRRSRRFS